MPGAALFILIQVILLIDFAYSISETLLAWWEESDDRRYLGILLGLTFGSYILSIIVTGFMYAWFGANGCRLNQFFISFNLVLIFITSIASIAPSIQEVNHKSGLGQSAMVAIYATYLIASALSSEPIDSFGSSQVCNPLDEQSRTQTTTVVLGSFFTFLSLAYSTSRAATTLTSDGSSEPLLGQSHLNAAADSGALPMSSLDSSENQGVHDDEVDGVQYNYSFFHFIFVIASMYLAMLVTNWDSVIFTKDSLVVVGRSLTSVWVKVISSWVVLLLYGWTVIAPAVLPDRNWD
jgi:hypothetical protein